MTENDEQAWADYNAEANEEEYNLLCVYSCPCGANDKGGSKYPEGICSRSADLKKAEELIKLQDEYIRLLGDEINSLFGLAFAHGWKSLNVEKGKELRDKIKDLKMKSAL